MALLRRAGPLLRMSEAMRLGVSRRALYAIRDQGELEQVSRGLYRITSMPALEAPDLVTLARQVPHGVVCLISALAYHELTTQVPHAVHIDVPRGSEPPRIEYPPVHVYWFSGAAYEEGIETHTIDKVPLRIYRTEKTLADIFKYRSKIGMDVVLEALRLWSELPSRHVERLLAHARHDRVERIIRPYLEAIE